MNRPLMQLAHTANLTGHDLAAARALVYKSFDHLTEDDWEQL